jgi:hypothetical protein
MTHVPSQCGIIATHSYNQVNKMLRIIAPSYPPAMPLTCGTKNKTQGQLLVWTNHFLAMKKKVHFAIKKFIA